MVHVTSEFTSSKDFPFSSASWIIFAALVRGGIVCVERRENANYNMREGAWNLTPNGR